MDKFRSSYERSQNLRDELDEIRVERDSLAKKANTVERYKQKLQASQILEKENQAVRGELQEALQQLKDVEQAKQQISGLNLAIEEYKRILPKIEQDRHELQMMKKQLEFDNATLAQRWETANEQHARDQETIAILEDKAKYLESTRSQGPVKPAGLALELDESRSHEDKMQAAMLCLRWTILTFRSRIVHLKERNQELLSTSKDVEAKNVMLEQMLGDAKGRHADLEKKYSEAYQEKLLFESSFASIQDGNAIEGYDATSFKWRSLAHYFASTDYVRKMRDELNAEQRKRRECEAELVEIKHLLTEAKHDRTKLLSLESRLYRQHTND